MMQHFIIFLALCSSVAVIWSTLREEWGQVRRVLGECRPGTALSPFVSSLLRSLFASRFHRFRISQENDNG